VYRHINAERYIICNTKFSHLDELIKQETQLSLTNRATRLEPVKVTKHCTIPYATYGSYYCAIVTLSVRNSTSKKVMTLKTVLVVHEGHYTAR